VRVLVTGFGPFPGVDENLSAALVQAATLPGHELSRAVLRTSFEACVEWVERVLEHERFDAIVHVGVGPSEYRLESTARNRCTQQRADVDGRQWPHAEVCPGAAARLETAFDVAHAVTTLGRAGWSVLASDDAGSYVCNFLYYLSLAAIERRRRGTRAVFLHVPPAGQAEVVRAVLRVSVASSLEPANHRRLA